MNLLTFDIEDYYHIFYRNFFGRTLEPSHEVVRCTDLILEILEEYHAKATFFVVGKVAERFPELISRIYNAGHEVSSHGYSHIYANKISADEFREDLSRSIEILLGITGRRPVGFRAPQFSVNSATPWAFDIMAELGFLYDSSVFPGRNFKAGSEYVGCYDLVTASGKLCEIPLSAVPVAGRFLPAAGGGALRQFPIAYNRWAINRLNKIGRSAVVYMHPYEFEERPQRIDYGQSSLKARVKAWAMHTGQLRNRNRSQQKLRWLLETYRFTSIADAFDFQS